ncbi:MAG: AAA family ATPase, partial [Desulfovibrionaceae bacterium]|nr:AAA family ATPase [Desulfovibrionaceae bacterium]
MSQFEINGLNPLPLGLFDFSNLRTSNMVYVDKTNLIYNIACQRTPTFFSRPRRFGKSLLINTLSCLFAKGIDYFKGLAIEKMWKDKTYPVVRLDFSNLAGRNA